MLLAIPRETRIVQAPLIHFVTVSVAKTMSTTTSLLDSLSLEVRELSLGTTGSIPRLPDGPPDPLHFLRDFVLPNRPCIISHAIDHWPALHSWTNSYLTSKLAHSSVSCHFTPDGRADAVVNNEVFASALVEVLPFPEALQHVLRSSTMERSVAYLQQQNNCFSEEFGELEGDADGEIEWASVAFGGKPEAVNLWIGSEESVTSFHKDHYENLYAVVAGEKRFTLVPPTDVHRMYVKKYPVANYERTDSGSFVLKQAIPTSWVPWVSVDPSPRDSELQKAQAQCPRYFEGPPVFECTVGAGELLYLPSMWFHHVRQSPDSEGRTIAVNYWYDMQFDMKYAYFNLVESLTSNSLESEKIPTGSNS